VKRWGISAAALVIFLGIFVFGQNHSRVAAPARNSVVAEPTKNPAQKKAQQQPSASIKDKKVETKNVTETEAVPYKTQNQNDASLDKGRTLVAAAGINGVKTKTYKVTYVDGTETSREKIKEEITSAPIDQITRVGTRSSSDSSDNAGPAGATALCIDGSFSFALNHQGACSKHGGVSIWYR
jgi:uncharacterized protein YabE (DUF348 family)